jgi:moderate conductance mechanosensitive channel
VFQLAIVPVAAAVDQACGPAGQASAVCVAVHQATGSALLARVADLLLTRPTKIAFVLAVAWVVNRLVRRFIRRLVASMQEDRVQRRLGGLHAPDLLARTGELPSLRRVQRAETIGSLLASVSSFAIWLLAGLTVLGTLGIDLGPLIAGAGIVGVALGFGSQNLVRDFIAGIFMLLEDQYGVGDVIDAGPAGGTVSGAVEAVGLRTTRLRDVNGTLWHLPNGEIRRVGNHSQGWARALVDVEVDYSADLESAIDTIRRVADELWRDEQWAGRMLEQPEVWGVEELGLQAARVRLVVKTRPLEQWTVARELRARIKAAFDQAGIGAASRE